MTDARFAHLPADRRPEFVDQGLGPEPPWVPPEPQVPRNPWLITLIASFCALFGLAVVFGAAAAIAGQPAVPDDYIDSAHNNPAAVLPFTIIAVIALALGILVLMMFVTARSVLWKAP